MKYFISGGTGYIGWELCQRLLQDGHEVVALCRNLNGRVQLPGLTWKEGRLENTETLKQAMEGCNFVFHCAALARLWDPDPNAFYRVNVTGTENVLAAARATNIERLVFTSTAGVYGKSLSLPLCEEDPRLEPFDNDYDYTKYLAEESIKAYAAEGNWGVIVSPSRVYGPGNDSPSNAVTNTLIRYIRQNFYLVPGDGKPKSNYVFVQDVVDGHIKALEKGTSGEKYTLGGENISYNQLFEYFENLTGLKRRRISVSAAQIWFIAQIMQGWNKLTGKAPLITPWYARRMFHPRLLSTEKAEKNLGYKVTPMEEGLSITLKALGIEPNKPPAKIFHLNA
jgi:nucleoside-diphosphate-sugar epimerase